MDFGYILQIALFALLALAVVVILVAAARAIPRSHKIKSYRYSKSGDDWINKYPAKP
jgi:ABC-type transporter Mla subunit MlaD